MKDVYLLSGLGADERAFFNLDLHGCRLQYLPWLKPEKDESIQAYARRLAAMITTEHPTLIGLSFGGIMAVEITKLIPTSRLILISSAKTRSEIPFYYKAAGAVRLNRIIPVRWLKSSNAFTQWFFGLKKKEHRELLAVMLKGMDETYLGWAVDKTLNWKNVVPPPDVYHIHGTADRLIPYMFVRPDATIRGGSHFMLLDRAEEISGLIRRHLSL